MTLVKFKDGKFGIRRGFWPFYKYLDFCNTGFWWTNYSRFRNDCRTTENRARETIEFYTDYGTPVK